MFSLVGNEWPDPGVWAARRAGGAEEVRRVPCEVDIQGARRVEGQGVADACSSPRHVAEGQLKKR
jgi:hypothetical protein